MVFPKSVTFPFSLHLKTAESGTSMMLSLARNAELTGNLGGGPHDFFSIHDGQFSLKRRHLLCNALLTYIFGLHTYVSTLDFAYLALTEVLT